MYHFRQGDDLIMDLTAFGKRIREERRKKDLTQQELADIAGVSYAFIGQIERGERGVAVETLVKICTGLDVTPNCLLIKDLNNMGDYFCQLWKMLMQNCSEKNQEMIISVVKAIVTGI